MINTAKSRKGQSAIEYLMTYGWMLLVVAIVGGAIFVTVQGQCVQDATGFTGESVAVESLEVTDDSLQLEVSNQQAEQINLTEIEVDGQYSEFELGDGQMLNTGDSEVFTTDQIASSDSCNDYDVQLTFDREGFEDATSSGSISGNMAPTG